MKEYERFLHEAQKCPKCGEKQICKRKDKVGIYLHCHACKYETKSHSSLIESVGEWNKEATDD